MPYTIEVYKVPKKGGDPEWSLSGEAESYAAAAETFDEACARNEGCAVILRGELGEVMVKRSVLPDGVIGDDDGS